MRSVSSGGPMRFCGRPRRFLRRRSSTADRGNGDLHRRGAGDVRGRAHGCSAADCPATYFRHKAWQAHPDQRCPRARRDAWLTTQIQRVWDENFCVYGPRKVWQQLIREGITVARCTVERLMRHMGRAAMSSGIVVLNGRPRTAPCNPTDLVNRAFVATRPNHLWVADLTYVATWRGFAYVAFVIDVFARCIVGWRVSSSLRSDLALDALAQALYARPASDQLIHHSDRGSLGEFNWSSQHLDDEVCPSSDDLRQGGASSNGGSGSPS